MLRTFFAIAVFTPWTLFIIITGIPLSLISPDYFHNYARIWARFGLWLTGMRLEVSGEEFLSAGKPAIYMANHLSNFDILALFAGLPGQFRWLAKEELFHIPLFGLAMRRSGYIPVNRGNHREAMKSMTAAAQRIAAGTSVVVFPEGTRSDDGNLLPFKKGGFMLALHSQVPIVPVAIRGSSRLLPKGTHVLHGGKIQVEILPAIPTAGLRGADRDRLMEQVQEVLQGALDCN